MSSVRSALLEVLTVTLDKRDKETLVWKENHNGNKLLCRKLPTSPKFDLQLELDGEFVAGIGRNEVFNHVTWEYQPTNWKKTLTDGRNLLHSETFDLLGRVVEKTENGATTSWVYDEQTGFLSQTIQPDGTTVEYSYDIRGNKLTESGSATYPIRYEYNDANQLVKMHTYRTLPASGELGTGDVTTWIYNNRNGLLLEKRYADGRGLTYGYNDLGNISQIQQGRADIRVSYNYLPLTGEISSVTHNNATPDIQYYYNYLGQCTAITDAAGTREFRYNILGDQEGEDLDMADQGVNSSLNYTIDSLGRLIGHNLTLNEETIHTESISYDEADRINLFMPDNQTHYIYDYREDNGWLDTLTYPNGMQKKIVYEANRDYISNVSYFRSQGTLLSSQSVTRDNMGRIGSLTESRLGQANRSHQYSYNQRGELTGDLVTGRESRSEAFAYDPIGNRLSMGTDTSYMTNPLNQYTEIQTNRETPGSAQEPQAFIPTYDADGNQTFLRSTTGDWQVFYNAENRPVIFDNGTSRIECRYDYKGRRVRKIRHDNNVKTLDKVFLYKGYLQLAELDILPENGNQPPNAIVKRTTWWDPTEPIATRPLSMTLWTENGKTCYQYTHTLNKNVSELVNSTGEIQASYDYDSFGKIVAQSGTLATENPFTFSSEYRDEDLGLMYYNFRHYNPEDGRWINRDPIGETGGANLYASLFNTSTMFYDTLGLESNNPEECIEVPKKKKDCKDQLIIFIGGYNDDSSGLMYNAKQKMYSPSYRTNRTSEYPYYHENTDKSKMTQSIRDYQKKCPKTKIVLIGHSYGGATAMDIAEKLVGTQIKITLLTLDAVSSFDRHNWSKERPDSVGYWLNAYIRKGLGDMFSYIPVVGAVPAGVITLGSGGGLSNSVAAVGGKWGPESGADINIRFDFYGSTNHADASGLLFNKENNQGHSAFDYLNQHLSK